MPKPRTIAREQRQLGRQQATRDALAAITALAPWPSLPVEAIAGYREQQARIAQWFSRAHRLHRALSRALSDTPAADEPG